MVYICCHYSPLNDGCMCNSENQAQMFENMMQSMATNAKHSWQQLFSLSPMNFGNTSHDARRQDSA